MRLWRLSSRRVSDGLVEIRLIGVPLAIHQRAGEHSAEVMREFAHVTEGPGAAHAPARLILVDRGLQEQYHRFSGGTDDQLEAAVARGDAETDLVYTVPKEAGPAAAAFGRLWQEVDAYCAEGKYLLVLQSPPDVSAYRRWVLGEFVRQTAGEPPLSWTDWLRESAKHGE
jgi:hypothetical protein